VDGFRHAEQIILYSAGERYANTSANELSESSYELTA